MVKLAFSRRLKLTAGLRGALLPASVTTIIPIGIRNAL